MVYPQKVFSGDYFFVCASGDNNVFVLMNPIPYIADVPEAEMPYEEVVDTMGDDILEAIE